jgi:hypothetical protein
MGSYYSSLHAAILFRLLQSSPKRARWTARWIVIFVELRRDRHSDLHQIVPVWLCSSYKVDTRIIVCSFRSSLTETVLLVTQVTPIIV